MTTENNDQEQNISQPPEEQRQPQVVKVEQTDLLERCRPVLAAHGVELNIQKIVSNTRNSEIVFTRALVCLIIKQQNPELSLAKIGKAIGGQSHASVINLLNWDTKKQSRNKKYGTTDKTYLEIFKSIKTAQSPDATVADI